MAAVHQRHRRTDGRTDRRTDDLPYIVHRVVKTISVRSKVREVSPEVQNIRWWEAFMKRVSFEH